MYLILNEQTNIHKCKLALSLYLHYNPLAIVCEFEILDPSQKFNLVTSGSVQ
jgi:hypothetical protein